MKKTRYLLLTAFLLASLFITASPARPAYAATLTVTNNNDSGTGSLRQAIADSNPGDTIDFDDDLSGDTITLDSQLTIDKHLTIDATSLASNVIISGNDNVRVFYVNAGVTAELKGLEIVHGQADNGGGIYNGGELTVTDSTFFDNSATYYGGGMLNEYSNPTLTNVTFSGNLANLQGGGMLNNSSSCLLYTSPSPRDRS